MDDEIGSDVAWDEFDAWAADFEPAVDDGKSHKLAHSEYDDIFDYDYNDKQASLGYYDKLLAKQEMMDFYTK